MDLNTLWFIILGALLAVYLILDGYDLGIAVIHLFTADRKQRQQFLALVEPYWDGNEVWLIIAGGVLFAVFPGAYAALLSGFYPHFIVLLMAFIMRGLALGLRGAFDTASWHRFADVCFGVASLVVLGVVGIVGANLLRGVPADGNGIIRADFAGSLDLPALLAAILAVALLAMHGSLYAAMRSQADQRRYAEKWAFSTWALALVLAVPATVLNVHTTGGMGAKSHPLIFALAVALLVMCLAFIPWALRRAGYARAFLASSLAIALFIAAVAMLLFPRLIHSGADGSHTLTIYNAAATQSAMWITLVIMAIALPLAVAYTVFVRVMLERSGGPRAGY